MRKSGKLLGFALTFHLAGLLAVSGTAEASRPFAAAQGTELFGGPGARGPGAAGSRFDTTINLSAAAAASGTVDFFVGGTIAATQTFSLPAWGSVSLATPSALEGAGPFLYRVRSDSAVTAWSETYSDVGQGRYSVSAPAFTAADFLSPGDEASGGGADASTSTDPGRARTNVGILCNPTSAQPCRLEVAAFDGGALLGTGNLGADPGAAAQNSLATVVPEASGRSGLAIRLRVTAGSGQPYTVKNDNRTSDGTLVPLATTRSAFSTAPTITSFTATPGSGCLPLVVNLAWATDGAVRVTITGVSGDLPPNGTASVVLNTTTDLVLTAYAASGQFSSQPTKVMVSGPPDAPLPSPSTATLTTGKTITGVIPFASSGLTVEFVQQQSTGSTFTVSGNLFTYVAGTTAGTDIVKLTATGTCGSSTGSFSATVVTPGAPTILTFTAEPPLGYSGFCSPADVILRWTTADATYVILDGAELAQPANGSYGFSGVRTDTTFKLTAYGAAGQKASATVSVRVDSGLQYPILSVGSVVVAPGDTVEFDVTGVTDLRHLSYYIINLQNGAQFQPLTATHFRYVAGSVPGNTDIIRITYFNGCGSTYSEFRAKVQ